MWRVVLLTAVLQVTCGFSRPADPLEGPLWYFDTFQMPRHTRTTYSDLMKQRLHPFKNEQTLDQNFSRRSQEKRAFSILARLRPFSEMGKQRSSIRQISRGPVAPLAPMSDLDIVSAETRAMLRPIGQPLRWG